MSSGVAPCFAFTISKNLVQNICPNEYANLLKEMQDNDVFSFSEIGLHMSGGFPVSDLVIDKFNKLDEVFKEKTGFHIEPIYYEPENGDIYDDDVSDRFIVYDVYKLKPLAENWFKSGELTTSLWTQFG